MRKQIAVLGSFDTKGEDYLRKFVAQDLFLGRDQRVLAESLAKGRVALMIGLTYYSYAPFIKAGLPVKALPTMKEGTFGTAGSGSRTSTPDCSSVTA